MDKQKRTQWDRTAVMQSRTGDILGEAIWFKSRKTSRWRRGNIRGISESQARIVDLDGMTHFIFWSGVYS